MRIFTQFTRKRYICLWIVATIFYLLYVEFYLYMKNDKGWLDLKCDQPSVCIRLLLVADPQIIGQYGELVRFLTPVTIYDSDLYLKKTFKQVYDYVKPEIVIFLGDLMDEGSRSTSGEFRQYVKRIHNIFLSGASSHTKYIWLPGDNDIGGEDFDLITRRKLERFQIHFSGRDVEIHKNVTFLKINRLTQELPKFESRRSWPDTDDPVVVGLSHIPFLLRPSPYVDQVIENIMPQILFTAHEHTSLIIKSPINSERYQSIDYMFPEGNEAFQFTIGEEYLYEFVVPTCSYRMGTDKIGYGFAVLEGNQLRYTILWSPSRFVQLKSYFYFIIVFGLITILIILLRSFRSRKRNLSPHLSSN